MGGPPPPGCWVPKQGPSPRPGRRMAQEAFEAYGKSSPLPALLPLPNPPGYVPPPVSMGTGGSRHGTLSTMRRRGDYRRGGNSGLECGTYTMEQGGKAQREPPPLQPSASPRGCVVPTSCLRRACNGGESKREPLPPPDTTAPPRAGKAGRGGAKSAPPPPEGNAAGWGGSGRRVRDEPHDRARRGRAPCRPRRGDHRGCGRRIERATKGAARQTPPPCRGTGAAPRASDARATEGKRQAPPPPPHASAPPRVGDAGREGRTAAPPPGDKAVRWGGSGGGGCGTGCTTAPKRNKRRAGPSGGGTGGANAERARRRRGPRGGPHTPAEGRVPCHVPVSCLRRAYARGRAARAPPPPPPPPPTPTKVRGEGNGEKARGQEG